MPKWLLVALGLIGLSFSIGVNLYFVSRPSPRTFDAISWKQCLTKCESQGCAFEAWTPDMCICGEGCISEPAE